MKTLWGGYSGYRAAPVAAPVAARGRDQSPGGPSVAVIALYRPAQGSRLAPDANHWECPYIIVGTTLHHLVLCFFAHLASQNGTGFSLVGKRSTIQSAVGGWAGGDASGGRCSGASASGGGSGWPGLWIDRFGSRFGRVCGPDLGGLLGWKPKISSATPLRLWELPPNPFKQYFDERERPLPINLLGT